MEPTVSVLRYRRADGGGLFVAVRARRAAHRLDGGGGAAACRFTR